MDKLQDQIRLKQTELNLATDANKKSSIQNQLRILRFKLEIEDIRDKIKRIEQL